MATPAIEGNRVPQVPAVQGGVGVTWTEPRIATIAAQARFSGVQFDDDANNFELGAFGVLDLQVSRAITRGVLGFVAVENLFDQDYDAGRTPIRLVGWPRAFRVGCASASVARAARLQARGAADMQSSIDSDRPGPGGWLAGSGADPSAHQPAGLAPRRPLAHVRAGNTLHIAGQVATDVEGAWSPAWPSNSSRS